MLAHLAAFFSNRLQELGGSINRLLILLGLRRHWLHWGTVYDSVTKQPLDPAVVRLIDVESGKVMETCITNMKGHYGFVVWPGKFKIFVKKSNFAFPSQIAQGGSDGIYNNLYHGEFFEVTGGTEVVSFNIPMDPVNPDWNQEAKKKVVNSSVYWEYFLHSISKIFFWFVLILTVASEFAGPNSLANVILILYGAVALLALFTPHPRLWGIIKLIHIPEDAEELYLELSHKEIPDMSIARAKVFDDGKFYLRVEGGQYVLKVQARNQQGQAKLLKSSNVEVGDDGLINKTVVV